MDVILDQSEQNMLCCRVCLLTDCKLFNLHEYKLADAFSRISGTPVFKGRLPQYLCTYCHTLLLKCAKFRAMCIRTETCLKKELLKGEFSTDRVVSIDHGAHKLIQLTTTEVETVNIPAEAAINETEDLDLIDEPKVEWLEEADTSIDYDDANSIDIKGNMPVDKDEVTDIDEATDAVDKDETGTDVDDVNLHTYEKHKENIEDIDEVIHTFDKEEENSVDEADIHSGNEDGIGKEIVERMMMNETRNDGTHNTIHVNNVVKIPELKMELKMLKGRLEIQVVKNVKTVSTITVLKNEDTSTGASKVKVNNVSTAKKQQTGKGNRLQLRRQTGNDNKTNIGNDTNEVRNTRSQIQIFKNTREILDNPEMLNSNIVKALNKGQRRFRYPVRDPANDYMPEYDFAQFEKEHGVKIVVLSKQEQLDEIAARKQSAKYLKSWYQCEICGKGFGLECTYKNHRQRHSVASGEHACEICHVRFKRDNHRQCHQDSHRFKFICNQCNFVSRSKQQAKTHNLMHQGKTFSCPYCDKIYSKPSSYFGHVRLAHPAMHLSCELCGETFIGARGLLMHRFLAHRRSEVQKEQQFKCTTCSASFVSADALKTHTDFGEHSGKPCEQCGESCASVEALQAHVEARHPPESHRCEECDATFSSRAAYDLHYRRKHLNERYSHPNKSYIQRYRKLDRKAPVYGQYMCDQCGRISKTPALLKVHQSTHLSVKPHACSLCPRTFINNFLLKEHIRKHTGEKPFHCDQCPRVFASKSNLQRHLKVVHLGQHDNARCPLCARVCTTRAGLRLHVAAVHQRRGWPKRAKRTRNNNNANNKQ